MERGSKNLSFVFAGDTSQPTNDIASCRENRSMGTNGRCNLLYPIIVRIAAGFIGNKLYQAVRRASQRFLCEYVKYYLELRCVFGSHKW